MSAASSGSATSKKYFDELDLVAPPDLAVRERVVPHHVVDRVHLGQEHRDALEAVGDLGGHGREVDAAGLLEVRELGDLHAVHDDLPAHAPGAERRGLPVVLLEADVVLREHDPEPLEAAQVDVLDVLGRGLQDDLELEVLAEPEGVLAVAAVGRPAGRLDVRAPPRIRPEDAQKRRRMHGSGAHREVVGLLDQAAFRPPRTRTAPRSNAAG